MSGNAAMVALALGARRLVSLSGLSYAARL